jgi:hypothetical protein
MKNAIRLEARTKTRVLNQSYCLLGADVGEFRCEIDVVSPRNLTSAILDPSRTPIAASENGSGATASSYLKQILTVQ